MARQVGQTMLVRAMSDRAIREVRSGRNDASGLAFGCFGRKFPGSRAHVNYLFNSSRSIFFGIPIFLMPYPLES